MEIYKVGIHLTRFAAQENSEEIQRPPVKEKAAAEAAAFWQASVAV
jgi:hypothetical protein